MLHSQSKPYPKTSDEAALDLQVRIFLECRPLIQAHIRSLVQNATLGEDVFQEVWVRFEKVTRHGQVVENVPAWCRVVARLVALELWRKQQREQPTRDEELEALVEKAYEEQDIHLESWSSYAAALSHCLAELPVRSRTIITRRYRDDQPIAEIAGQLGQSLGSIKTALCRLRGTLAQCVRKQITTSYFQP